MAEDAPAAHVPSIRERMAALNLDQVARTPSYPPPPYDAAATSKKVRAPPPALPKRPPAPRGASVNNPPIVSNGISSSHTLGNEPAAGTTNGANGLLPPPKIVREDDDIEGRPSLPPRRPTMDKPPPPTLPPRRSSATPSLSSRRTSQDSISSVVSSRSSISGVASPRSQVGAETLNGQLNGAKFRVRAPEYDPASLPPLPERKLKDPEEEDKARGPVRSATPSSKLTAGKARDDQPEAVPSRPTLPLRPNTRTAHGTVNHIKAETVQPLPRRSALSFGLNRSTETPPPLPAQRPDAGTPPPIPLASRPNLAALQASKPKPTTNGTSGGCLRCRDFSGPDDHAARFPRESIPSTNINWLANELTAPFTSLTDKARTIFTWEHHNIRYDVDAFFGNRVQPSTPASTLASGLAVCEGYAGLFSALAAAAGLEAVVVCGHGKGYGYNPAAPPPVPTGHAWNAVRIDDGEWKLIDPCWGAGHIECEKKDPKRPFVKSFNPSMFTMSNEEFGERHYPEDDRYFFRPDGRRPTFQEYFAMDQGPGKRQVFDAEKTHGISERSIQPEAAQIHVTDPVAPTVRFQFNYPCRHWDPVRHGSGKPFLFLVKINGVGGAKDEWIPMQTDGYFTWCDVPREKLGRPGQQVMIQYQKTYLDGRDARGLTLEEYKRTRPLWRSWSWGWVASWNLV